MTEQKPFIARPQDTPALRVVGDVVRVLAEAEATGRQFEVFAVTGPRDSGPPPHAHPWTESYFLTDGDIDVLLEGEWQSLHAGDFALIPADTLHAYRVASAEAKFVVVTGAGKASSLFRDLHDLTDVDQIVGAAIANGLRVPPPPQ